MKNTTAIKGNITLTTVLFVSVILLLGGITLVITNIDFTLASKGFYNGTLAQIRSRTCLNDSLLRLKTNTAYTGSFTISFTDGTCSATVANGSSANTKTISLSAAVNGYSYSQTKNVDTSVIPFRVTN
jgi:hypothetical protein